MYAQWMLRIRRKKTEKRTNVLDVYNLWTIEMHTLILFFNIVTV